MTAKRKPIFRGEGSYHSKYERVDSPSGSAEDQTTGAIPHIPKDLVKKRKYPAGMRNTVLNPTPGKPKEDWHPSPLAVQKAKERERNKRYRKKKEQERKQKQKASNKAKVKRGATSTRQNKEWLKDFNTVLRAEEDK